MRASTWNAAGTTRRHPIGARYESVIPAGGEFPDRHPVGMGPDVERELRQLDLISERLARSREGQLAIGSVINDLEALQHELQTVDEPRVDQFVEAWSDLEIPYATALDRLDPIPTIADGTVAAGVEALDRLVSEARASLTD